MSPAMRDFGQKLIEIIGGSSLGGEFMPRIAAQEKDR